MPSSASSPRSCWTLANESPEKGSADETWLRLVAQCGDRSYEQMPVMVLEFLETDVFTLSSDHCVTVLDPLIES